MPEQYAANDKRTGLEVTVTGTFPDHPQDRIRIARTTNLFTRLTSTILSMEQESDRREAFIAVETQMELAEALIRHDNEEVQRLLQATLEKMGITPDQMRDLEEEIRRRLGDNATGLFGFGNEPEPGSGPEPGAGPKPGPEPPV